jgi:polysaccharide biosynthesis/export protein
MERPSTVIRLLISLLISAGTPEAQQKPADLGPETVEPRTDVFRIGAGDTLGIDVWKEPDASSPSVIVRPDGYISLPMLGQVKAAGSTPDELQALLAQRYGILIRDARVTVVVKQVNIPKIYVIGEVRREGAVRLEASLTVLQALAEAGGVTDYAKRKRIYILRVPNGRRVILPFDYDAVLRGNNIEQNILLQPGDTVVVPR